MAKEILTKQSSGNLTLIISSATLLTLAAGLVHMGRQFERLNTHYKNDWCVSEMEVWANRTQKLNPELRLEDVRKVHNEVTK
jgi:hypothetical protein